MTTTDRDPRPYAVVYENGAQLFLPEYHPTFVQRMKARLPAHTRVFHQVPVASYTIIAPHHKIALALAGEYFPDFLRVLTNAPYTFPGDDAHLLARRGRRGSNFGERALAIMRRQDQEGGR